MNDTIFLSIEPATHDYVANCVNWINQSPINQTDPAMRAVYDSVDNVLSVYLPFDEFGVRPVLASCEADDYSSNMLTFIYTVDLYQHPDIFVTVVKV